MVELIKNRDGSTSLLGTFTNRYQDRDGEIITDLAHQEYIKWLDANPDASPQLQFWHMKQTAFDQNAIWWAYDNAFVSMLWPLTEPEAAFVQRAKDRYKELGMSHGFKVIEQDGNLITKYRTFEASILPRDKAANYFTEVNLMEDTMPEDKLTELLALVSDDVLAKEFANRQEQKAVALDESGVQTKEVDEIETATDEEVEPEQEEQQINEDDIVTVLEAQNAKIEALNDLVEGLTKQVKSLHTKEKSAKANASPRSLRFLADTVRKNSVIGDDGAKVDGCSTLAKSKPQTTNGVSSHVLGGLFGGVNNA